MAPTSKKSAGRGLGDAIREEVARRGTTLERASTDMGLVANAMSRWNTGIEPGPDLLSLRLLVEFCRAEGLPCDPANMRREHLEKFIGHSLATRSVNTAGVRYRSLVQFFKWLVSEEEIQTHPMSAMSAPVAPEVPIPVVDDEALRRLLRACDGKEFMDRRDTAILRLFIDTHAIQGTTCVNRGRAGCRDSSTRRQENARWPTAAGSGRG